MLRLMERAVALPVPVLPVADCVVIIIKNQI